MAVLKLVMVLLLVAYASAADFNALKERFNKTIVGQCNATTTAVSNGTSTVVTTDAPPDATNNSTTNSTRNGGNVESVRIKRQVDPQRRCVGEEEKVLNTTNLEDFKTKLNDFFTCTKDNCKSLEKDVEKLIQDSGASAVKFCGLLLVLLFTISYFG